MKKKSKPKNRFKNIHSIVPACLNKRYQLIEVLKDAANLTQEMAEIFCDFPPNIQLIVFKTNCLCCMTPKRLVERLQYYMIMSN